MYAADRSSWEGTCPAAVWANGITQAEYYAGMADACLAVDGCVGITLWSHSDRYSWIPDAFPGEDAAHLTDESLRPKPAYDASREALGGGG